MRSPFEPPFNPVLVGFPNLTSHMCETMGASAQECSAFRPFFPFLYSTTVNDLSNHLRNTCSQLMLDRHLKTNQKYRMKHSGAFYYRKINSSTPRSCDDAELARKWNTILARIERFMTESAGRSIAISAVCLCLNNRASGRLHRLTSK